MRSATALGLVRQFGPVDRHEDLGDARFGLADVACDARLSASSISASETSTCGRTRRRMILVQAICASICCTAMSKVTPMLWMYCLNWPRPHAGGALDVAEALLHLAVGGLQAEPLGVLDLQAFVDHLAQHLGGHALAQVRAVLQAGGADGEQHALLEVEIGDGVVIDARHHAQPWAEANAGSRVMTTTRRVRRNSADIAPTV